MAQAPAQKAVKMSLSPMAQRAVLHAFMATPPAEKQTTRLFTMIAERNWPETMALSVNRFGDWRDKAATAKKLFDAQKIRRFVRKKAVRFVS